MGIINMIRTLLSELFQPKCPECKAGTLNTAFEKKYGKCLSCRFYQGVEPLLCSCGQELLDNEEVRFGVCFGCMADAYDRDGEDAVQCESVGCGAFWPQRMISEVGLCPNCEDEHSKSMDEIF